MEERLSRNFLITKWMLGLNVAISVVIFFKLLSGGDMMLAQYQHHIGTIGTIAVGKLSIEVRCLDVKNSYGNIRYLIEPVAGTGQTWTEHFQPREERRS